MEDKALLSTEEASGAEKAELLIVIPAYNEAENIERVVNHLTANFPQYDYVVVNDGSRDETALPAYPFRPRRPAGQGTDRRTL